MRKFVSGALIVAASLAFAGAAAAQCKPKPEASIAPAQTQGSSTQVALIAPASQPS